MSNSTFWKKFFLVLKVIEVRLRFIAILVVTALVIGYWDTITNYWDKWTRSAPAEVGKAGQRRGILLPHASASGPRRFGAQRRNAQLSDLRHAAVVA